MSTQVHFFTQAWDLRIEGKKKAGRRKRRKILIELKTRVYYRKVKNLEQNIHTSARGVVGSMKTKDSDPIDNTTDRSGINSVPTSSHLTVVYGTTGERGRSRAGRTRPRRQTPRKEFKDGGWAIPQIFAKQCCTYLSMFTRIAQNEKARRFALDVRELIPVERLMGTASCCRGRTGQCRILSRVVLCQMH